MEDWIWRRDANKCPECVEDIQVVHERVIGMLATKPKVR